MAALLDDPESLLPGGHGANRPSVQLGLARHVVWTIRTGGFEATDRGQLPSVQVSWIV